MTEEQAIAIAGAHARGKGSDLTPEVFARRIKRFLRRSYYWRIVSNIPRKGGNWFIEVDETTGQILSADFTKR
jgi:hypothetical protein